MPVMIEGVYQPASQEEKDAMYANLQVLDPGQQGLTLDKFRARYPKTPWGEILVTLRGLQADGRAKAQNKALPGGSPTQFEHWTWL